MTDTTRYHEVADLYAINGERTMVERMLDIARMLRTAPLKTSCGRGPATMLTSTRDDWLGITHSSHRDEVSVCISHRDGRRSSLRIEKGNGDPTGPIAPARGDASGLRRFADAFATQLEACLDTGIAYRPSDATLGTVGRAMRLHRRRPIVDWRREVHVQTRTPWSPPRVFNVKVDQHGDCVADRNMLGRTDVASGGRTAVVVTTNGPNERQATISISPFERSFDPDAMPIVEEMRAYAALDAELAVL